MAVNSGMAKVVYNRWAFWITLAVIFAIWGWHIVSIAHVPQGFSYDEAYNAIDAFLIQYKPIWEWPVFFHGNFGREPLLVYLISVSFRTFGPSIWSTRLPNAIAWGMVVLSLYWLASETFYRYPHKMWVGIASMVIGATNLWISILTHFATRSVIFALIEALFFASLLRAWNTQRKKWAIAAGIFWGISFYTYLPSRLFPPLLLVLFVIAQWCCHRRVKAMRDQMFISVPVAIIVMMPLLLHFYFHPDAFLLRSQQVVLGKSSIRGGIGLLAEEIIGNGLKVIGMFFVSGDSLARVNLPGRPVFTWAAFPLLVAAGMGLFTKYRWRLVMLLVWVTFMLTPTWLSEHAPSFQRAVGAWPPLMVMLGYGSVYLALDLGRFLPRPRYLAGLAALLVGIEAFLGMWAFHAWAHHPAVFYASEEGLTRLGRFLAHLSPHRVYIVSKGGIHPTLTFFNIIDGSPHQERAFDARHVMVAYAREDVYYVVLGDNLASFEQEMSWIWPQQRPSIVHTFIDPDGRVYAKVYWAEQKIHLRTPLWDISERWKENIRLVGAEPRRCCTYAPGETINLYLWWEVENHPPTHRWTVFTHLLDSSGYGVTGKDCEPGCASYPTTIWEVGETIITKYPLRLPPDVGVGTYFLEIGWYDWRTGRRLPLEEGNTDAFVIGEVSVRKRGR